MSQHTPGPWYRKGSYVSVPANGKRDTLGTPLLSVVIADCQSNPLGDEVSIANARLISSAPDLLLALEALLRLDDTDLDTAEAHNVWSFAERIVRFATVEDK